MKERIKHMIYEIKTFVYQLVGCKAIRNVLKYLGISENKPLNLDFNMENFFTEEGRIRENRQRLRELYEQYKRIENYYPIFLAYLSVVGYFLFDLIAFGVNHLNYVYYNIFTSLSTISILYTLYLIWDVFKGNNWTHDYLPKDVCDEYVDDVLKEYPELKTNTKEFDNEILKKYRKDLDGFVNKNYDTYDDKTKRLKRVWKPIIFSLILMSINITSHKTIDMKSINESPKERITNESVVPSDSVFNDKQVEKIVELIHGELIKYDSGKYKPNILIEKVKNIKDK